MNVRTRSIEPLVRIIPWRAIALLLFLLPAVTVLLRVAELPCTHDNALHYYRITALRDAWRHGWVFSRWIPNLALGFGYPFFNFREPLPYVLGTLLYAVGIPLPLVLGLLYAGSLVVATWGAYVLGRGLFGERAAWITALAYGLGPYLLLDAMRRGNMPESVALALLPWLLVTFRRIILGGGRRPFTASVMLLAALFLSHNITSLLFAPFLGGYVVLLSWLHRDKKAWPWAFGAVVLVVLLTAWFWFPALTEQDTVQLHLSRTTRNNDFHYNFATWQEMLLALPTPFDADFLNPPMRVYLGVTQAILAVVGAVLVFMRKNDRERRVLVVYFAVVTIAYLWMSTPSSVAVWEAFPILAFVQFPWRLVGRALLSASLLASAVFSETRIPNSESRIPSYVLGFTFHASHFTYHVSRISFWIALGILALFSWPDTLPPKGFCSMKPYPGMTDVYAFEQEGWMGVDPEGSYFPVWVEQQPSSTALATAFERGEEPARFDVASMPDGARLLAATYRPLHAEIEVETPSAFQARWFSLYFPGWTVRIDGQKASVLPEPDTGLLTFVVPKGRHTLDVRFSTTSARLAVTCLSLLGVIALGSSLWRIGRSIDVRVPNENRTSAAGLVALAVGLFVLKSVVVDRVPNPLQHSRLAAGELPEVSLLLDQPFVGGLALLGYDVDADMIPADGEVQVDLLWVVREGPSVEYRTVVLLHDPDGQRWSPEGTLRPRGYEPAPPTTMWRPGQYAYDPHIVQPLPGTPPGEYTLVVGLFDRQTLVPASVLDVDGNPARPDLTLGSIRITSPAQPSSLRALHVPDDALMQRCGPVALWSMTADRERTAPGGIVGLRWVWEAVESPGNAFPAELALVDAEGVVMQTWELPLSASWWPTDRWSTGERWVGRPLIRVPGGLESGVYRLVLRLPGCESPLAAVSLAVESPDRVWQVPDGMTPIDVQFGESMRLAGFVVEPQALVPGEKLHVWLAWQALAEMETSYRIFVHLQDASGHVIGQSDGEPANWQRPTTGWAVGEVVTELREIDVPADLSSGTYVLRVGVYRVDPPVRDGTRLTTTDGQDAYVIFDFGFLIGD